MNKIFLTLVCLGIAAAGVSGCADKGTGTNVLPQLTFKKGAVYTYDYYVRDSTNTNIPASKLIRKWTVLETGLTYDTRSDVAKIDEATYLADGVTLQARDTTYVTASSNGEVYLYDLVGATMRPLIKAVVPSYPDSAIAALGIAKVWVKISDTKSAGATTWISATPTSFSITNPIAATLTVGMTAKHLGTQSVTTVVPKTYASSVHTDHTLTVQSAILYDSTYIRCDVDNTDGLVRMITDSKKIVTLLGATQVPGSFMELTAVVRP